MSHDVPSAMLQVATVEFAAAMDELAQRQEGARRNAEWWRREWAAGRLTLECIEWLIRDLEHAGGASRCCRRTR